MKELAIEISTIDGVADGFLYIDETAGPKPGVAFYTDIFGIRKANRDMASRLCLEGHTVLLPNVFYRTTKPPIIDRDAPEEEIRNRFGEIRSPLTTVALLADAGSYIDYLSGQPSVANGKMGAVGYCFTGKLALYTAAARSDRVSAAASFHGGGLYTDDEESPHRVLPDVKSELYFGHAFEDRSMSAEAIANLEQALTEWGGDFVSEIYRSASHGWTVPDSPVYDRTEAEKAHDKLAALFRRCL